MTSCSCMFLQLIMSSTNSRDKLILESSDWCHTWFVIFNTASKTEARQDDCSKNLTFDCLEMFWKRGEHEYHIYWNSDHMWYKKVPVPKERHEWGLASDGITLSVLKKIPWDRFQWTKFMPSCKMNSYRRTRRGVREEWAEQGESNANITADMQSNLGKQLICLSCYRCRRVALPSSCRNKVKTDHGRSVTEGLQNYQLLPNCPLMALHLTCVSRGWL
jgi:hypothetical protein